MEVELELEVEMKMELKMERKKREEKEKEWEKVLRRFQDVKDLQQNPFQSFLVSIVRVLCDQPQCARLR